MRAARGFSAVEVTIASAVAALLAVPLLALMWQERDTAQRARFEYLAVIAAREEMYEARLLAALGASPGEIAHEDWQPLEGDVLARLANATDGPRPLAAYRPDQSRIETRLEIAHGSGRLRNATLQVRWSDPQSAAGSQKRPSGFLLTFGLLLPPETKS